MRKTRIGFIGGGNMARSLIGGLIADGVEPARLWVSEPDAERRRLLSEHFQVHAQSTNQAVAEAAEVLVFAVKPQVMRGVCEELAALVQRRRPLVVSIAAGIRSDALSRWLGGDPPIVRAMPNTPSLVQAGAAALYANQRVTGEQRELAEAILRAVGLTLWVDSEEQMDSVTAVSGSGPAYFFLVMEAMEEAAVALGLARESARLLVLQTAFGAAKMALESPEESAALRARVTSPGGTTERAVEVFMEGGLPALFERALRAARERSQELAEQLGGER